MAAVTVFTEWIITQIYLVHYIENTFLGSVPTLRGHLVLMLFSVVILIFRIEQGEL
jgi:uncharacterized protein with PQ loop repeat